MRCVCVCVFCSRGFPGFWTLKSHCSLYTQHVCLCVCVCVCRHWHKGCRQIVWASNVLRKKGKKRLYMKMRAGWLLQYSHLERWAFQAHRPSAPLSPSLSPRTGSPPWGQTDCWRPLSTHESHTDAEAFSPPKTRSGQTESDKIWTKVGTSKCSIQWYGWSLN